MKNIKNTINKVAAIHDLSGFGRASLSAIIPVLSTMKAQVCPVPTAILSTHTGGFSDFSFVDLTLSMENYINHWKKLNINFDCIYSGFLGSPKQIDIVLDFIENFGNNNNLIVVDPVMADDGKLYATMDKTMIKYMKKLIKKADIITPNFTEACYLLDEEYDESISEDTIKKYLKRLSEMGPKISIITSVPNKNNKEYTSVIAYDRKNDKYWKVSCKYIPTSYPGTGDIFASVLIGSLLQGDSLPIALDRSVQFITIAIRASYGYNYPQREGVLLEKVLDNLKMPVLINSYEIL